MSNVQLEARVKLFCDRYLIHFNGTKAAEEAGYSKKTAPQQASRLLKNVKVQAYLSARKEKMAEKLEITQERILQELGRIALSDIRRYYNADGSLKSVSELDDDAAAALSGIEADELWEGFGEHRKQVGITKKIKRFDKIAAVTQISKMMGWNAPDKIEHSGDSFLDLLMKTSFTDTSENKPRQQKKPKPKGPQPTTKPRRKG